MYYIKRLFSMNYKQMLTTIDKVHKRSGKSKIFIFFDMILCSIFYQAGYMDYYVFCFEDLKPKIRKTFITRGVNNQYIRTMNNREYYHLFDNKIEFNHLFQKFLNRDYLDLNTSSLEEFQIFTKKYPIFMAKPVDLQCGKGIEKIKVKENTNLKNLYQKLIENKQVLVEEYVLQHSKMNELFPYSVNTLRIVSAYKNGKTTILFRAIRIGNGKNVVDNFNHGGMYSVVNEKGIIEKPAIDKNGVIYTEHPVTKTEIVGFQIPYFKEAIAMVKEAAKVVPEVGLVGFDIAITEKGPVMIEGNQLPGYDIYQSKIHLNSDGTGMKPLFDQVIYGKNN